MSGFIVRAGAMAFRDRDCDARDELSSVAFSKKGMKRTLTIEGNGFVLELFCNASHDPARALTREPNGSFCTYVGTLIYEGKSGASATAAILRDVQNGHMGRIDNAIGNYCLLLNDETGLRILTDRAGMHHVYLNDDLSFACNSFVATACSLRSKTFGAQEVIEYVMLGATFGDHTLLKEVRLLGSEQFAHVQGRHLVLGSRDSVWRAESGQWKNLSIAERLTQALDVADNYYGQLTSAFGSKITAALSGGYDSRLNLGLLLKQQVRPALFVYGNQNDVDVRIAKLICRGEGLELSHVDREYRPPLEPEAYWQNQEEVFHGLDGLTQYGFVCEPFEVSHRRTRVAGGLIAVNGGGGEIWRDFWKVPDRSMSAHEFVRAYFEGRFDGLASTEITSKEFLENLGEKVDEIVGSDGGQLSPMEVQSLYPRLRLRYWQGKNNSVDNFIGHGVTPFSEHHFAVPADWIPLREKQHGRFERQLIQRTSPSLARYPSSHGYALDKGPDLLKRLKANVTRVLPVGLRAKHRKKSIRYGRSSYQSQRFIETRFGKGPMAVEKYFNLSQLGDSLAFSRALTVERMLRGEWL